MTTSAPCREQAFTYLHQAEEELARGDLRQASEKGWGAAAQMVKAIAENRGLEHKTHRHLFEAVSALNNNEYTIGFAFANSLHTNFYEGGLNEDSVRLYLTGVDALVHALASTEMESS